MSTLREAVQQFVADYDCGGCGHFAAYAENFRKLLAQQTQTLCDIAEDGVCEVIDCCRNSPQILEALEIGYDSAQAEAAQYHAAMAGYRPERHAAMDADVQKIAKAISTLKAALAQEEPKESVREMLIGAAAMAVAAERKGVYPGASEVADAVLAQEEDDPHPPSRHCMCEACKPAFEPTPGPEQEPVAWRYKGMRGMPWSLSDDRYYVSCKRTQGYMVEPLYTHPPRREWRGLTEEEINALPEIGGVMWRMGTAPAVLRAIRAIEAKLKEKNT